ncbi:hypothetical protein TVAG_134980 [Trichomonas vaginalis G3]|uniref:Uncharacterized protein n=1 Tax=Trichomonas vaginalis (strain ATCC PRA-98 / G3) TaxID=412133 RepID=A2FKH9_TRIV3|nr:tubby c-terminal domain-like family [Trichomonas vaginalis G3]EAX94591.1 hypothetical protein TVAG_134980 [Trichomonas vaginalis G3]KAI5542791.1 tubby c-terminal domain-like family [Trichomonas vaginalis G3]|eukprot:XP_001307521.1 hypothetical protein [Trichomonas vaginalis G3]
MDGSSDSSDDDLIIISNKPQNTRNTGRRTRPARRGNTNTQNSPPQNRITPFVLDDSSESEEESQQPLPQREQKEQNQQQNSPQNDAIPKTFVLSDDQESENSYSHPDRLENSPKIETKKEIISPIEHENEIHSEMELESQPKHHSEKKMVKKKKKCLRSEYVQKLLSRPSTIYRVHRYKIRGISQRLIYQVFKKNEVLYTAKGKSVVVSLLRIQKGEEAHLSSPQFDATIKIEGWLEKKFQLYTGDGESSEPIMVIDMHPGSASTTRFTNLIYCADENLQQMMPIKSREPIYNETKGTWQLDFLGKFVLRSVKNAIIDGKGHSRLLTIRKIANEDLELETTVEMDPLYILNFGIAAFMV